MPSVDPRAAEIIKTMSEFETSVADAEIALVARDWPRVDELLSVQHRLTHALANGLEETKGDRPQAFTDEVNRRIARISESRADQLRRLIAFNHLVKARLTMISRSRELRRVNADEQTVPHILNMLQ